MHIKNIHTKNIPRNSHAHTISWQVSNGLAYWEVKNTNQCNHATNRANTKAKKFNPGEKHVPSCFYLRFWDSTWIILIVQCLVVVNHRWEYFIEHCFWHIVKVKYELQCGCTKNNVISVWLEENIEEIDQVCQRLICQVHYSVTDHSILKDSTMLSSSQWRAISIIKLLHSQQNQVWEVNDSNSTSERSINSACFFCSSLFWRTKSIFKNKAIISPSTDCHHSRNHDLNDENKKQDKFGTITSPLWARCFMEPD